MRAQLYANENDPVAVECTGGMTIIFLWVHAPL